MKKVLFHSICLFAAIIFLSGCGQIANSDRSGREECVKLLEKSREGLVNQDYETAMTSAMDALAIADSLGYTELKAECLCSAAHIYIVTSHDDQAWDYASQAENISRHEALDRLTAKSLILKGRICVLAQVSPDTGRDDEAISYLDEAIRLSRDGGYKPELIDALFNLSQAYVNKNRWNEKLDMAFYRKAGECLSEAEELSEETDDETSRSKALAYRMRYFRQGGKTDEAIFYCNRILESCAEDDYLMKMQAYDFLTALYAQKDDIAGILESHELYSRAISSYHNKSSEKKLMEIAAEYETSIKDQRIRNQKYLILCLIIILALSVIWLVNRIKRTKLRNIELQKAYNVKEELVTFLSKELKGPLSVEEGTVPELADYMTGIIMARNSAVSNLGLTKRELEVLRLSAEGLTVKDIAEKLCISDRTVGNHRTHIFEKMDVKNISEMINKASKYGII